MTLPDEVIVYPAHGAVVLVVKYEQRDRFDYWKSKGKRITPYVRI
jgi:hypothetical protein